MNNTISATKYNIGQLVRAHLDRLGGTAPRVVLMNMLKGNGYPPTHASVALDALLRDECSGVAVSHYDGRSGALMITLSKPEVTND